MTDTDDERRADDEPSFDRPRRAVLLGAGTALTGALAGCSGGGGDGDDDGDGTAGDGGDGTTTGGDDGLTGSVTQNDIDGIEVTEVRTRIDSGAAKAYVTFENTGDETISYVYSTPPYSWGVSVFDADGELLLEDPEPGVFWWETSEDAEPGETAGVNLKASFSETSQAARVEITIACADDKDNAYC